METQRLYEQDSHAKVFRAHVTACEAVGKGYRIALDRTCFFPEGGGQFGDRGVLTGDTQLCVTDTQEENGVIWHHTNHPLTPGTQAEGRLDWPLRFARMQCHSGEHIVSGLFHQRYGLENVGFHLGDEEMTLDLSGPVTWEEAREVERLANQAVALNLPVQAEVPSPEVLDKLAYLSKRPLEGPVRIVIIPGYDVCACCAPHVSHTGEIGLIHILSLQNYKSGVRLRALCGSRAVEDILSKQQSITDISVRLSARQDRVAGAVERLAAELECVKQRNATLGRQLAQGMADAIPAGAGGQVLFTALDTSALRTLVNAVLAKGIPLCAAFAQEEERWQYIVGAVEMDLRPLVKEMNAALRGRGGGSAQMVQGSVQADRKEIAAWWTPRLDSLGFCVQ